jgi:hypothetical protein
MDRLQGVMGHAFQFEMRAGGGGVMHDNLDWGYALAFLPEVAQFRTYEASKRDVDIDLPALKREARDAARESLDRGVPALVWQPMSREQKKGDTPAHHAYCWGLIVGYDEGEETYTIRHPFVSEDYTVGYDLIGHSDGVEWFNVTIFEQQSAADEMATHRTALGNAVALSEGTKFDNAEGFGLGFDAYELWRAAFESEDVEYHHSRHHTEMLKGRRLVAAAYLRELANLFRDAAVPLEAAAGHYDREQESLIRCMSCSTTGAGSRPTSAPRRAG